VSSGDYTRGAASPLGTSGFRPRFRRREAVLLGLVAGTLFIGHVTLVSTVEQRITIGSPGLLAAYLVAITLVHLAFVFTGRRTDQILFPAAALLGGISLLLMERLPQDLVTQEFGGAEFGLAPLQLGWLVLSFAVLAVLAIVVRSDNWLRLYKYTWAAVGIGLLLLVFVVGREVNGARLSLCIGPACGQPSELLKVILVVFLAGYLADNRALLVNAVTRLGPIRLPPVPYLLPMLAMWGIALSVVVVQRDLGAALLFFLVFLLLLYIATSRALYLVLGLSLFLAGGAVLYRLLPYVQLRVDTWLNPWADPLGSGYQAIHALYAFGRGGILGTGLGAGLPSVGSAAAIPAVHTDFVFAALAEELGLLGALAILGLYLVLAQRGLRIASAAADDFRSLLAAGLTLVVAVQAAIIVAGNAKLIPLTGITLPFISYGGSSLVANAVVVGLLLALSDRGVEPPPPPKSEPTGRFRKPGSRARPDRAGAAR
jgi:cell division protein FtsW (lipid II flippase)